MSTKRKDERIASVDDEERGKPAKGQGDEEDGGNDQEDQHDKDVKRRKETGGGEFTTNSAQGTIGSR